MDNIVFNVQKDTWEYTGKINMWTKLKWLTSVGLLFIADKALYPFRISRTQFVKTIMKYLDTWMARLIIEERAWHE